MEGTSGLPLLRARTPKQKKTHLMDKEGRNGMSTLTVGQGGRKGGEGIQGDSWVSSFLVDGERGVAGRSQVLMKTGANS